MAKGRRFAGVIKVPNQFELECINREIVFGGFNLIR